MKGATGDTEHERSDEEEHRQPKPGPEHDALGVIIGKWINEGHTVASVDAPSCPMRTRTTPESHAPSRHPPSAPTRTTHRRPP